MLMAEIGHPTGNIGIAVPGPELPISCLVNETQVLTVSFWPVNGRFVRASRHWNWDATNQITKRTVSLRAAIYSDGGATRGH